MSANALWNSPAESATLNRSRWRVAIGSSVAAAALNALIFAVAVTADVFPSITFRPDAGAQMSIEPILLVSILGTLAGFAAFELLRRRVERPVTIFHRLGGAVLLMSFAAPLAIPGTVLSQVLILNLLHIVVAAAVLFAVRRQIAEDVRAPALR